jgi:hypothetical protein
MKQETGNMLMPNFGAFETLAARVEGLRQTFAPPNLKSSARLDRARQARRERHAELQSVRTTASETWMRLGQAGRPVNQQPPEVKDAMAALETAEKALRAAIDEKAAAKAAVDSEFEKKVADAFAEAAPTLRELVDLLEGVAEPVSSLQVFAFGRDLPIGNALGRAPTLAMGLRAMRQMVNSVEAV